MAEATPPDRHGAGWALLFSAWLIALFASLAVLFVGEVMGQTPCNLCWFQRAFMFPLAVVLGVASWRGDASVWRYGLPLAICGLLVAGFHTLLYMGAIPERIKPCSQGGACTGADMTVLGGLPLPVLAVAAFGAVLVLLLMTRSRTHR
ncbi:disulfide bond formation protein B [Variovorax sp. VNK109]|uniref:disulfide bond formation protein B n=1 Tax=Variovorax sp. VNK109 TaxID=3400919 RepID=UPI003BFE02CA